MTRAFVTGGLGFIGAHLVNRLVVDGYHVTLYDRKDPPDDTRFTYIRGNILNPPHVREAMRWAQPDIVFHLAALADVRNALNVPTEHVQTNFCATANVLEAMRATGVKQLAFTSSAVVYGDHPAGTIREDTALLSKQTSVYGAAKRASEALIEAYCVGYDMRADIFRLVSVVGEGYRHGNLIDFYHKLKADPTRIQILGSRAQEKYYIYIGDMIEAMMLVTRLSHSGAEIWNVSHHRPGTIDDSIDAICEELRVLPIRLDNGKRWIGDQPNLVLDTSKLRARSWSPRTPIYEGMRRTVQDFVRHNL